MGMAVEFSIFVIWQRCARRRYCAAPQRWDPSVKDWGLTASLYNQKPCKKSKWQNWLDHVQASKLMMFNLHKEELASSNLGSASSDFGLHVHIVCVCVGVGVCGWVDGK